MSNMFAPPETVTGLYVIDSLIEGNLPKAMDALMPSGAAGNRSGGLYHGTDHENDPFQSSGRYVYGLCAHGESKGTFSGKTDPQACAGQRLIPVLTVIGLGLGNLLGGMVLVETIFNWPGVGQFAL